MSGSTTGMRAAGLAIGISALLAGCGGGGLDAPSVGLGVAPPTIPLGNSATLSWTSTGAVSCTASGAWTGPRAINGTEMVTPSAVGVYTYTLSCSNGDRGSSISGTVTVTGAAPAATAPGSTAAAVDGDAEAAKAPVGAAPALLYLPDSAYATPDASGGIIDKFSFAVDGSGVYQPAGGKAASFRWTGDAADALSIRFAPGAADVAQLLAVPDAASSEPFVSCVDSLRSIRIERGEGSQVSKLSTRVRQCSDAREDQTQVERTTRYWVPAGTQ